MNNDLDLPVQKQDITTPTNCKNCSASYTGNFCPNCGQKAATHDIDSKYMLHEIPHAIFHVDKGILYTIVQLSTRPGKTVLEYIRGKRVHHYSPIAYILILSAIFLLVNKFVATVTAVHYTSGDPVLQEKIEHLTGFIFLSFTPVFALYYTIFFGRRTGLNYWQFLVANTFFIGHIIFLLSVLTLLISPFKSVLPPRLQANIITWLIILYQLIASAQMLRSFYKGKVLLIVKLLAAFLLSAISSFFVFMSFLLAVDYLFSGAHH